MKKRTVLVFAVTHAAAIAVGFAIGIYALPILTAPPSPDEATLQAAVDKSTYAGRFERARRDSDALHWGEGEFSIDADSVSFVGRLAPGPDYRLYLSPGFVETEADFKRLKSRMAAVGDVKTFDNFIVALDGDIDPADYHAVIVWCESFGQFITSGEYTPRAR